MPTPSRPQRTIAREAEVRGVGFLSGADVRLRFRPAEADTGIVFVRTDLPDRPTVPATIAHVVSRPRRTTLERGAATVEMVEHVMAALAGLRVDNCTVEIDAPETPGCDGSSRAFVAALGEAGVIEQDRPRSVLIIDQPITVRNGEATLTAHPGAVESGLVLSYNLDYGRQTPIGAQSLFVSLSPETFQTELASSRTFLLEDEARALRQAGIGTRTRESDLLVFGAHGPINNTLRFPDECARHKMLDLLGDLALLGRDLTGHVVAHRSGHQLNAELVRKLAERADAAVVAAPEPPIYDVEAIMKLLPHRYPFLLIDRVVELDGDRRVNALKNVTFNEPFFQGHWPGRPIMPGVLILEALAQAAGILIGQRVDSATHMAMIVAIDAVKIRKPVVPGDQLYLEVVSRRAKNRTMEVEASARVGDQLAAEATIRFVILEKAACTRHPTRLRARASRVRLPRSPR